MTRCGFITRLNYHPLWLWRDKQYLFRHLLSQAKVPNPDLVLLTSQEYILRLEISVEYFFLVDCLEADTHLQEVLKGSHFCKRSIILASGPQHPLKVTTLAVLHHYVYLVLTRYEGINVLDNKGCCICKLPVQVDLVHGLQGFSLRHLICLELFDDH